MIHFDRLTDTGKLRIVVEKGGNTTVLFLTVKQAADFASAIHRALGDDRGWK